MNLFISNIILRANIVANFTMSNLILSVASSENISYEKLLNPKYWNSDFGSSLKETPRGNPARGDFYSLVGIWTLVQQTVPVNDLLKIVQTEKTLLLWILENSMLKIKHVSSKIAIHHNN